MIDSFSTHGRSEHVRVQQKLMRACEYAAERVVSGDVEAALPFAGYVTGNTGFYKWHQRCCWLSLAAEALDLHRRRPDTMPPWAAS
jgi:hypothetical protein